MKDGNSAANPTIPNQNGDLVSSHVSQARASLWIQNPKIETKLPIQ